jgi:RNA-directed DNA polymerase
MVSVGVEKEMLRDISPVSVGEGGTGAMLSAERQTHDASEKKRALTKHLMESICSPSNLNRAYKRVKSNKGAAGVDGMQVSELGSYIRRHKVGLLESLLSGSYRPQAVLGVEIPKASGGKRLLGIPTVLDRLIQQAIHQVLEPIFEPMFSDSSYGFRPRRSAHMALKSAQRYVATGRVWVVDIDLAKYFDQVNHDILMSRLSQVIGDKRLLRLIRRFLQAGMMRNGEAIERESGTPQGGPLSPLLSNIMLDELDKELETRGHCFCRYADDCNIYVYSEAAGQRVMSSVKQFLKARLKLSINEEKSAVSKVYERQFLGYRIGSGACLFVSPVSLKRMKNRVRTLTRRSRGRNLELIIDELNQYLVGWLNYFKLAEGVSLFNRLDSWIRRRLRCYRLKQRKRKWPMVTFMVGLGVSAKVAWNLVKSNRGWWAKSHYLGSDCAMSNKWFNERGLFSLYEKAVTFKT